MALIGYARVSTEFQNLAIQLKALKDFGCEKIYTEKQSGMNNDRSEFKACIDYLRKGDKLVLYHQDRLSRDALFSLEIKQHLEQNHIELIILSQMVDTTTPEGKFTFTISAAIAQLQRDQISERTKAALKILKERGEVLGRPRAFKTDSEFKTFIESHAKGLPIAVLAKAYDIQKRTVHKYIKLAKDKGIYPIT
jgi:DNA invertase Pin-like site-specific DNA recombinase